MLREGEVRAFGDVACAKENRGQDQTLTRDTRRAERDSN